VVLVDIALKQFRKDGPEKHLNFY